MSNLLTATVKIKGVRPLFLHAFTEDTLSLERKERTGVAGNDPEEWKRTFTATKEGQLYVDSSYAFGMLREAAKYTKSGKASIQKTLAATLQVMDDKILFNRYMPKKITRDENEPVFLDVRGVKNPSTKARNIRYRVAMSKGWEAEFTILWDRTLVSESQMKAVLEDAGTLVGLADGRSIGYGRFEVASYKATPYKKEQLA